MCGIAFIKRMGKDGALGAPILKHELDIMLTSLEYRGNDATGLALQDRAGRIAVYKDNTPAFKFTAEKAYERFLEENLTDETEQVILHTRKYTKGSPFYAKNNHPLFSGHAAIVHNGMVTNDDWLFNDLKLERGAETDSDIIRAMIDAKGVTKKALEFLNRMSGTCAAVCIHPDYPGSMLALRSSNPLVIATTRDKIFGASDKRAIYRAAKPFINRFGIITQVPNASISFVDMYDDTGWLFNREGLEFHGRFVTGGMGRGYIDYHIYNGGYEDRQKRLREEAVAKAKEPVVVKAKVVDAADGKNVVERPKLADISKWLPRFVFCPNCKTNGRRTCVELDEVTRGKYKLYDLNCRKCHTNLAAPGPRPDAGSKVN